MGTGTWVWVPVFMAIFCGLTGQQKFPSAQESVSQAKPKTESDSEMVKTINSQKAIY
jgi:hypothetical protein